MVAGAVKDDKVMLLLVREPTSNVRSHLSTLPYNVLVLLPPFTEI